MVAEIPIRPSAKFAISLLFIASLAPAQPPQQEFTDPLTLLAAVSETYAANPDSFHVESITETVQNNDLQREWRKVYRTAIKGPGNLYRIETRSPFGSYIQDSDGTNEWVYMVEAKMYVVRPLPQRWPQFPKIMSVGNDELSQAWQMRTWLEAEARGYKHATMLPEETIVVEGRSYPCYVVHVTNDDAKESHNKDYRWDRTFWIDKSAHVFRKQIEHSDSYIFVTKTVHVPFHRDTTTVYPVADFDPQTPAETFRFVPPTGAKEVASLEPDFNLPPPTPTAQMVGKEAPEISFTDPDGKKVELSSYRGKPLLIDFWATWCGPCLLSMPSLNSIDNDYKGKGLTVLSFDQNDVPDSATEYLARHHYTWTNYHDTDHKVSRAFKGDGIPLTVLIDAQGKIAYYDWGGDEISLRNAIAALGPKTP
jgi:thiol-disulfide isomerase/thioredoxin/outer membrane lipoprotein-sorting protein